MAGNPSADKKTSLVKVFDCPQCGGQIQLLASGQSLAAVCGSCHSVIDVSNKNYKIISEAKSKQAVDPYIPIGQKGLLFGDKWQVIGFMRRCDETGLYFWHEYLLFNPFKGFRWLFCYNGHWTFYEMTKQKPSSDVGSMVRFDDQEFRLYLSGQAKVVYVLGEFYWKVKVGETTRVADYINPPQILSSERNEDETIWSLGQYTEPSVIADAFGVKSGMPFRVGVAPNQPNNLIGRSKELLTWSLIFFGALTLIQIACGMFDQEKSVFKATFVASPLDPIKIRVTEPFQLDGNLANVQILNSADVRNNWLDLDATLVNSNTGQKYVFNDGVEYYSGSDSDGPWSEGEQTHDVILQSIPGGTYTLSLQPTLPANLPSQSFTVEVKRNVFLWSNYWVCLFLLLIYPLGVWLWAYRFETSRWSDSDYSPYQSHSS